jgi:hypothetical protein
LQGDDARAIVGEVGIAQPTVILHADVARALFSSFLLRCQGALFGRLATEDRTTEDGRVVMPGVLRKERVSVGRYEPPPGDALGAFLALMNQV